MRVKYLTHAETRNLASFQLASIGNSISKGEYGIKDIGNVFPGAVMVQDLNALELTYMNRWGCDKLGHSLEEMRAMGDRYYREFFYEEETRKFLPGMIEYVQRQDCTALHDFYQRVKTYDKNEAGVYYTACKLLTREGGSRPSHELLLISNPVATMGLTVNKLSKLLAENQFAERNHHKFELLTIREKEIIRLLAEGKSSGEISDELFISSHTVTTHRKNISRKLDISSFAELIKFANAFDLIRY